MTDSVMGGNDPAHEEALARIAEEEREAMEAEVREYQTGRYAVRLTPDEQRLVHEMAARAHVGPTVLLHQWISERIDRETDTSGELGDALEAIRRDLERAERLSRRAS